MTTEQTDFMSLYRELGVAPDCSVDEFRLAYRRRVSGLHPDRAGASGEDDLKTLNLHFAAALEFHRHYGRLPGAVPPPPPRKPSRTVSAQWDDAVEDPEPPARRPSKFVVYGMLVLAALLVWWWSRTTAEPFGIDSAGIVDNQRQTAVATATRLLLPGMTPDEVLALHGAPVGWDGDDTQWLYGPSWIRFRCARVVDWYSSPLKPLKVAASKPSPAELARLQADQGPLCPPMPKPRTRQWPTSP